MERPKVIYNDKTKKFVMWFHLELKGKGYAAARSAVAVSDSPTGPFRFLRSGRINPGKLPFDMTAEQRAVLDTLQAEHFKEWWTPQWYEAIDKGLFLKRDLKGGQMARDMQLFVDDDGKAYHIYSSEDNLTLQIAELSEDYLSHTGKYTRLAPAGHNEAPAIFKKDGIYWMITSGCTGWDPNEARMFSAPSIWGPWTKHPNPCIGPKAELTFGGQSTFVLKVPGKKDAYMFMADIWRPKNRAMHATSGCLYSSRTEYPTLNGWTAGHWTSSNKPSRQNQEKPPSPHGVRRIFLYYLHKYRSLHDILPILNDLTTL